MDEGKSWLRTHWRTALALVLIFGVALFLRFYFVWDLAFTNLGLTCRDQPDLPVSGGSDSFYWHRALCYSYETGKDLDFDTMLNYGWGNDNPRPPLFPWFALLVGKLLAPLFPDPWHAVLFVFLASTGLFGALTVFPTYLLTKEAFGRSAGLVAAFLLAVSSAHMQRSQATDADHDAWSLFFVVLTFYFFLRSLKVLPPRRWVENWSKRDAITAGVRAFFAESRKSVLYAVLAGLCIAVIALSWQGWAYVPVILLVYFVVQLFLERVRNNDTMGLTILFGIAMLMPLVLAFPWYAARNQIRVWFDVPAYLFLVTLVLGTVFTVTRDYPWTLVIPSTLMAGALGLGIGVLVNPALANAFVSGAGYFVRTKLYETIAEAQAPGLSQLILSFGFFTFYFSLAGVGYMLWQIPKRREAAFVLIVIWAFAAIFMAMAAARFIFNASPAFAVTAAFAIDRIVVRADFAGMRRTYRSLVEGSWRNAVRKALKFRHILVVLLLVGGVLLPNVWWGVDAAIPFELKSQYDRQIHEALPSFLRAPGFDQGGGQGSFYLGAFGYALPQPTEYFPAAWKWFRTQDADRPAELRPAFLSWWDYGFEAVDRGRHPTVADNFQNGYAFAGQFITAQNETQAVSLLAVRLLESDLRRHGGRFSAPVERVLEGYELSVTDYRNAILRPIDLVPIVRNNPGTYGIWDQAMQPANAMFIFLAKETLFRVGEARIADFYRSVRAATGQEIGYFAVDARLFPISATNTGIFYAPVKLSDHRVIDLPDGRTLPIEFYEILVNTDRLQGIPIQNVGPGDRVTSQEIRYKPMFYNSMFYRAYVGYSPTDLGTPNEPGIPGFSQNLAASPPIPAWNLSHFRVVYRTAYYNPFTDPANHTDAWQAMNYDEAQRLQGEIGAGRATGVVDPSTQSTVANGIVFLRYYDGAWVNGTVRAGGVTPIPNVRVTVSDELGTPHGLTTTDANGRFSLLAPFGNVTITASVGRLTPRNLVGSRVLGTATFPVSLSQAMRENADANGDGILDWLIARNIDVPSNALGGTAYFDLDGDGSFGAADQALPDASITFRLLVESREIGFRQTATTRADGSFAFPPIPTGTYRVTIDAEGRTIPASNAEVGLAGGSELSVPFAQLQGSTVDEEDASLAGAVVEVLDETTGTTTIVTSSNTGLYEVRPLLQGNYTVVASLGDRASVPERVSVSSGPRDLRLALVPSGRVAGTTRLFGLDQPFATLQFQRASDVAFMRTVSSDGTGAFEVTLPAGEWSVNGRLFAGTALYAHLGRVAVLAGQTTPYDAMFVDGARVEGTVKGSVLDPPVVDAQIAFLGGPGDWWIRTNRDNAYLAYLPKGAYGVQATTGSSAFYGGLSLLTTRRLDLELVAASTAAGRVFRDRNGDGLPQDGEEIPAAFLRMRDDLGRQVLAVTDAKGEFRLIGLPDRTYTGQIEARGFREEPVNGTVAEIRARARFPLAALPVDVRGAVVLGGSPLVNRPVTVRAEPVGEGAIPMETLTDSGGGFALSLVPGVYDLVVDENVSGTRERRYQNPGMDRLVVGVGQESVLRDLPIVVRSLVTGEVTRDGTRASAAVSFRGPDARVTAANASGFEVYLQTGPYEIFAASAAQPNEFLFLGEAAVLGPSSLALPLARASQVSGTARFQGAGVTTPLPIAFDRLEGGSTELTTEPGGSYTIALPPGAYDVRVDAVADETVGGVTRFFRYRFSDVVEIPTSPGSLAFNLDLARSLENTTLTGTVRRSGVGLDATIEFLPRGGGALEARTTSAPDGSYAIGLAPGTYDVYATRVAGSSAFLGSATIPPGANPVLPIDLEPGFVLSGVVTDVRGARATATLTIEGGSRLDLSTDSVGAYQALLPAGTYTVTASRSGMEHGIPVDYRASETVDLNADRVANLPLEKVVRRSVTLSWDASQAQTIPQAGSVEYTVEVRNTGNVEDTFRLTGRPNDWTFTFLPSTVPLDFGDVSGSRTTVRVTIRAPADALVNHAPVTSVATSSDGVTQGTLVVDVSVARVRALSLSVNATSGTWDGRFLNYSVEVRNRGNDRETVTVFIANPGDLASVGWTARLVREDGSGTPGPIVEGLSVAANSTERVRLQLESARGPSGVTVVIQTFSEDTPAVAGSTVHVARMPELSAPEGAKATGPNVVAQPPILSGQILTILIAAVAAIAAGVALTRRRR